MEYSPLPNRLCAGLLLLITCVIGSACAVNPVTGERELALISEQQEVAMGQQAAEQVRQSMAMVDDAELQNYVDRLGQKLAAQSERPDLPWSFGVVDDPTPNAFALPGGPVFVTRGMLSLMDSEAELVAVLGHEIGHITARHSVNQMSRAQLAQLGLGLGAIFVPEVRPYGDLAGLGLNLMMSKYSRDDERQADELGFRYTREQGYAVSEMADVFASLQRAGEMAGQSAIPGWLATHPAPQERVETVRERVQKLPGAQDDKTVGRAEFLNRIDGLVYGNNPRNGYFHDNVFYHPELAFQFRLPDGWQHRNLARAVVGISAAEDAALQFTLAGDVGLQEAARRFGAQNGMQTATPASQEINGIDAVITRFQAQAQQGQVAGYAAHFQLGGQTYQLVTYTSAQKLAQYQPVFEQVIQSFAPVTDSRILERQPARIETTRLPRAMSLAQFAQWSSSSIPLDELALINQVEDPGATIDADTLLKAVHGDNFGEG